MKSFFSRKKKRNLEYFEDGKSYKKPHPNPNRYDTEGWREKLPVYTRKKKKKKDNYA